MLIKINRDYTCPGCGYRMADTELMFSKAFDRESDCPRCSQHKISSFEPYVEIKHE